MLLELLKKNLLNIISSLKSLNYFLTPYILLLVTFSLNVMDNIIMVSAWAIMVIFNAFFIIIFIKKRDIQSRNDFIYLDKSKILIHYWVFSLFISFPYFIIIFFCLGYISIILITLAIFFEYICALIALSIKEDVLFRLKEDFLSSFLILFIIILTIIIEYLFIDFIHIIKDFTLNKNFY